VERHATAADAAVDFRAFDQRIKHTHVCLSNSV
jgi:hypothetical protein